MRNNEYKVNKMSAIENVAVLDCDKISILDMHEVDIYGIDGEPKIGGVECIHLPDEASEYTPLSTHAITEFDKLVVSGKIDYVYAGMAV